MNTTVQPAVQSYGTLLKSFKEYKLTMKLECKKMILWKSLAEMIDQFLFDVIDHYHEAGDFRSQMPEILDLIFTHFDSSALFTCFSTEYCANHIYAMTFYKLTQDEREYFDELIKQRTNKLLEI